MKSKYSLMIVLTAILMYYLMDICFIIDTKFVVIQVERTKKLINIRSNGVNFKDKVIVPFHYSIPIPFVLYLI